MGALEAMFNIHDHPVIRAMEATGYPDGREPEEPICPVCDAECDAVYRRIADGDALGCECCTSDKDAWDVPECFEQDESVPHCPMCGKECETIYARDSDASILGCENCVEEVESWKEDVCYERQQYYTYYEKF